jgi:hypothetical protein
VAEKCHILDTGNQVEIKGFDDRMHGVIAYWQSQLTKPHTPSGGREGVNF